MEPIHAPGDIRCEEVPVPEPGPGEVLIKVKACGVCGSDIPRVMQTGTYRFPTIPGHEFSGEVVGGGPGTTIAVDIFPEKLQVARDCGADLCIDARGQDPVEIIREYSGGAGVERTLEFAGQPVTQEQCILATAKHGASVWGGISHSGLKLSEKAVDAILRKEMTITGSWNSSFTPLVSDCKTSLMFMGRGKIKSGAIISHRLPLNEIAATFQMMQERRQFFNKVMFFPER